MGRVQRSGDARAFALLVCRWEGPIQRLCTRMTGDPHRGEDLAQEAFARIFAHREDYRRQARFATFLWRIALNLCRDEKRKAARRRASSLDSSGPDGAAPDLAPAASTPSPHLVAARRERAHLVRRALAQLPEHYRAVVVLRHYEGLKFREIAEVLEIPLGTVKSRMAEALSRLARTLRPLGSEGR
jgi:RNA polymerase sigma-70 factor (ECF subfamily)